MDDSALRAGIDRLGEILEREHRVLEEGAIDALAPLQAEKRALVSLLADERVRAEAEGLASRHGEGWRDVLERLEACRRRNLVNGAVLNQMIRLRQHALALLAGHPPGGSEACYAADGSTRSDTPSRSLGHA